ncbi:MAG: tautomerase family protein [Gammaproteobacteria bacterium]|nr:tautomerase family protein [Gammaproteobacteria bacterium]MBU1468777.1 tautomerase family protein [Gammaproteobacteria bacterium]MBU2024236.1 tautomerase family protein [Gammaproteobacteria bacterium]MBU2238951.1 tautomerase family protein [Gammaproteobacteria bacterium]MBU2318495.1 tautomerase family protein [Gammaproteobacteria bacterium]
MPFTHIYISADKPNDYVKKVSQSLHEALTESFLVPQKDYFQIINRLTDEQRVYDKDYACPVNQARSKDWLLFEITAGKPRDTKTKAAFYKTLLTKLQNSVGLNPADLMVIISTNQTEEWSFSHGAMATLP